MKSIWRVEYVYNKITCEGNNVSSVPDGLLHQGMGRRSIKDRLRDIRAVLPHHAGNYNHVCLSAYVGLCDDCSGNVFCGIPCKFLSCGSGNGP